MKTPKHIMQTATLTIGALAIGTQGLSTISSATESHQDIYQTMTHCDSATDCSTSTKTPNCKLTLTYEDDQLILVEIFGNGVNQANDRGFYSLSNDPSIYRDNEGPKIQKNEINVRGDRIDTILVATSLRWNIYREVTEFKIRGFTPEKISSVESSFLVKLGGIPGAGIIVDCQNLTKLN